MRRLATLGLLAVLVLSAAGIGFVVGQSSTEEVRVVARSVSDGRIEFGIEHDEERLLPTGRFMNAAQIGARNDRWLRSTPVNIEVGASASSSSSSTSSEGMASVSGSGPVTKRFALSAGIYTCAFSISGNDDDGRATFFSARLYDSAGDFKSLAGEIASQWSGSSVVHVGGSSWTALTPGTMLLEVGDAELTARWRLDCN